MMVTMALPHVDPAKTKRCQRRPGSKDDIRENRLMETRGYRNFVQWSQSSLVPVVKKTHGSETEQFNKMM